MLKSTLFKTTVIAIALTMGSQYAIAQVINRGAVIGYAPQPNGQQLDYANAKPLPMPQSTRPFNAVQDTIDALTRGSDGAADGSVGGAAGSGLENPALLGVSGASVADADSGGIGSQEWGTSNLPFSTAKADLNPTATNKAYPYRASGKLFFMIGSSTYVCSASLIKRGVIVTAAHCVTAFGGAWYTNWQFVPGYRNGVAPYGVWTAATAWVMSSYKNGTDTCSVAGVVCANDVATIVLNAQSGSYPGTATGWYGYGWDGFGFVNNITHITQIGYPVCLDNGLFMERNDAQGLKNAGFTNNTTYGSLMCGGSSGGPLVVNFGVRPALTGTVAGSASGPNRVVGVTSWGYVNNAVKQQGASPFTSGNIVPLVNASCPAGAPQCS
jgi:V8-like Glu-specific endopeptidase